MNIFNDFTPNDMLINQIQIKDLQALIGPDLIFFASKMYTGYLAKLMQKVSISNRLINTLQYKKFHTDSDPSWMNDDIKTKLS